MNKQYSMVMPCFFKIIIIGAVNIIAFLLRRKRQTNINYCKTNTYNIFNTLKYQLKNRIYLFFKLKTRTLYNCRYAIVPWYFLYLFYN